jgi:hypothetical protein
MMNHGMIWDLASGNLLQLAIEAMAHRDRAFTVIKDCDFP